MATREGAVATATRTHNEKIGDVFATYAAQQSCPSGCVFRNGGCYAETGQVGKFVTAPLNAAADEADASALEVALAEADAIDGLDGSLGLPLRLHVVGDCATDETARIVSAAAARYVERGGGPVWTYTHAWGTVDRSSWGEVNVLASCETHADMQEAHTRGYAPSLVVDQFEGRRKTALEAGFSLLPCPAQTTPGVTCATCRLCTKGIFLHDARMVIGFEIHGLNVTKRAARAALTSPDDPLRRVPSEERIRLIRLRYLDEQGREPTKREVMAEIPDLHEASVYEWLRFHRGEIVHPAERRRLAREAQRRRAAVDSRAC